MNLWTEWNTLKLRELLQCLFALLSQRTCMYLSSAKPQDNVYTLFQIQKQQRILRSISVKPCLRILNYFHTNKKIWFLCMASVKIHCNLFPLKSNLYYVDKDVEDIKKSLRKCFVILWAVFLRSDLTFFLTFVRSLWLESLAVFDLNMPARLFVTIHGKNENIV